MNTRILLTYFIITLFSISSAIAQKRPIDALIDSLRLEIADHSGAKKASAQLDLALKIMEKDKDEAIILAESALKEAIKLNDRHLLMLAYYSNGRVNEILNKKDLPETQYQSALTLAETLGDNWNKGEILLRLAMIKNKAGDKIEALKLFNAAIQACRLSENFKSMGLAYSLMGTIFRFNGLYDRAIEYTIVSKISYEKAGFSEGNAWSSYVLGRIYSDMKLPGKAMDYYREALKIYLKIAADDGNLNGVALCYEQIGLEYLNSGKYSEAREYIDKSFAIYKDEKSDFGISNAHKLIGMTEYYLGNFSQAEKYLNEALIVKTNIGDQLSLPTIYEYLGLTAISLGKTDEGILKIKKGLELAQTNNQKKIQLNIYASLTKVYLKTKDLNNAILTQNKQIEILDSIQSGAANIKIEQLQAIYEIDKKNSQIIELEKQNQINKLTIKQHRIYIWLMVGGITIAIIISVFLYWIDSKIKQINRRLIEANAAKDKLFAIIAHDLRGPTVNLTAFLEHLNESFGSFEPNELKDVLKALFKSADSVSVLLENLLFWAQSQLNKIECRPIKQPLSDLIHLPVKGLKPIADNKQIEINFELNEQISVMADPNMVQVIIRNLISNAIKFTPKNGQIVIKTFYNDLSHAGISISDTGIGIEKKSIPGLFNLNNTYKKPGTENEKSVGLGLLLVKDFVEKNKGTISIDSELGEGTTVLFTLPLANESNLQNQKDGIVH